MNAEVRAWEVPLRYADDDYYRLAALSVSAVGAFETFTPDPLIHSTRPWPAGFREEPWRFRAKSEEELEPWEHAATELETRPVRQWRPHP